MALLTEHSVFLFGVNKDGVNDMDTKQKSLLGLTVLALGFLGYQIFELVSRDMTETPVTAQESSSPAINTAFNAAPKETSDPGITAHVVEPVANAVVAPKPVLVTTGNGPTTTALNDNQRVYVNMMNQYELEKMQHQLLDEKAAVAKARQEIAMSDSKTRQLTGDANFSTDDGVSSSADDTYHLSYIDKQSGQWSATLHHNAAYQSVSIGTLLPDGFHVTDINHQGVTLENANSRELITFNGTVQLPALAKALVANSAPKIVAVTQTAQAKQTPVAQEFLRQQSHQLAVQLIHHGQEVKGVSRAALAYAPVQPSKLVIHNDAVQMSIHDQYAQESADNMGSDALAKALHLRDIEITPISTSTSYSASNYIPQLPPEPEQSDNVYNMLAAQDVNVSEHLYGQESADTEMPAPLPLTAAAKKLIKEPKNYYTIQLIGSYHKDVVDQFVLDNELRKKVIQLSLGSPKDPWTIALYGAYSTFEKAEKRLVHLSPNMRINGAWIRKIGDVQRVVTRVS